MTLVMGLKYVRWSRLQLALHIMRELAVRTSLTPHLACNRE